MHDSQPWILGIASSHNGSACLLHGHQITAAIQEERLLRQKRAVLLPAFPSLAVEYCLRRAGISPEKLDAVVVCAAAAIKQEFNDVYLNEQLKVVRSQTTVFSLPHHLGHGIGAYALSGMSSTGVLVIDGNGSPYDELWEAEQAAIIPGQLKACSRIGRTIPRENISLYDAKEGALTPLEKHVASYQEDRPRIPGLEEFQSLGDMYAFTGKQIFGSVLEGSGKVMGLAPFGEPVIPVHEFYRVTELGFEFQDAVRNRFKHNDRWPRHDKEYKDLAASVQKAIEEAILLLCSRLRRANENLCYAGGVALNSVANERIIREAGFRNVFIMPAAEDSGTAVGAAFYGLWQLCGYSSRDQQQLDNFGCYYSDSEISSAVHEAPGILASKRSDVVEETADLLEQGKIVGWYQGGAELGPRALGQRSIFCDPRHEAMKNVLNERVKFREAFRPFAPIIPEEDVYDWFEVERPYGTSPFMLRVLPFRAGQTAKVPAVVHVDGTGRVQTVSKVFSPRLYGLLRAFQKKTAIPILLNTSFNIAGEPIVETPDDALACFLYTDMDYCVLGDYILSKDRAIDAILDIPILIRAQSAVLHGHFADGRVDFPVGPLPDTSAVALSGPISRIMDVGRVTKHDWFRLVITVRYPWGEVIRGLPSGFIRILKLVDGRRTGKEIYAQLITNGEPYFGLETNDEKSSCDLYPLSLFRKHLGLLRRVGAIGFAGRHSQIA